jgi:hypothetical protein
MHVSRRRFIGVVSLSAFALAGCSKDDPKPTESAARSMVEKYLAALRSNDAKQLDSLAYGGDGWSSERKASAIRRELDRFGGTDLTVA